MLIAHGPIAVLTAFAFQKKEFNSLSYTEKVLFIISSVILGILPDFDMFYLVARGRPAFQHHDLISHTPIFWIVLGIILFFSMKIFKFPKSDTFKKMFLVTLLIGALSHIFADLFTGYIMLLYPFSNQYFTFLGGLLPDNMFSGYLANPIFGLEILIISIFIFFIIKEYFNIKPAFIILLSSLYFVFNCFMYSNTYQIDMYKKNSNGSPIYDTDRDSLADSYDYDYDNNFVNNFDQVPKKELFEQFQKVLQSTKFIPSKNRSVVENVTYYYGGHDILRGILQSYAQTGNYLTPVVHDYMERNSIKNFSEGLYPYLLSTQKFKNFKEIKNFELGSLVIANWNPQVETSINSKPEFTLGVVIGEGLVLINDKEGKPTTYSIGTKESETFLIQD